MRIQTGHTALGSVSVSNPNTIFPVHIRKRICEHKAIMIFFRWFCCHLPNYNINSKAGCTWSVYFTEAFYKCLVSAWFLPKMAVFGISCSINHPFFLLSNLGTSTGLENRCSVHGENENNNKQIYMTLQASLQGREFHPNIVV